jgi:hypothetical protein
MIAVDGIDRVKRNVKSISRTTDSPRTVKRVHSRSNSRASAFRSPNEAQASGNLIRSNVGMPTPLSPA